MKGFEMSKEEAILRYKASMSVFKNWFDSGAITEKDLLEISTALAEKYGLSLLSIFLETTCYVKKTERVYDYERRDFS